MNKTVTVVTCYYKVKSKYTFDKYNTWINKFLSNIKCNIIIFTSSDLVEYFESFKIYNENIFIIVKELYDLDIYKKYINIWDEQWNMDNQKNIRTKYTYIIWNSKVNFLKDAIELNPFNSDKFIWNDIGVIRDNKYINILKYYPDYNQISVGKIDIILLNYFDPNEKTKFFQDKIYFAGGIFGSDVNTLLKYHSLYYAKFDEYIINNKFIGCDQQLISSIYLENMDMFNTIKSYDWFYMLRYYSNTKFVIFKPNGRLGNAIFRYLACSLICIKNNYKYILEEDFENNEENYIFYKHLDYIGSDIYRITENVDKLKEICYYNQDALCFNSLGFLKSNYDINSLKTNNYINRDNHGLYVKNTITITDNNYHKHYNNIQINNLIMKGFFQYDEIYLENKKEILQFIEDNKNIHYIDYETSKILIKDVIDDIQLPSEKIYDIVIHLRLGDFNGKNDFIDFKYLKKLFSTVNFANNKCAIVVETPQIETDKIYINNCLEWFKNNNININIESNSMMVDFNIMKQCKVLICSMSTLSWCAGYLSKKVELCYMPNYNFDNIRNCTSFKYPIKNTLFYNVQTTKFTDIKIVILTLKEHPERNQNINNLLNSLSTLGITHEIFYGIYGKNIKIYDSETSNIKLLYNNFETYYHDKNVQSYRTMEKGNFGCAWSHLNIYKKLLNDQEYDKYLIFEDDAHLCSTLSELYNVLQNIPEDFDLCHIAQSDAYKFIIKDKINESFYNIVQQFFNRLTAYIISKKGAQKIVNYSNNFINVPSDYLISSIYLNTKGFNLYVPEKHLFYVPNEIESVTDIINANEKK